MKYSLRSFKFSTRDLLWLTVVVAFAVAWSVDRSRLAADRARLNERIEELGHRLVWFDIQNYKLRKSQAVLPASEAPAPNPPKNQSATNVDP